MPNDWTGDFDVVLQVSESTINRLLATMHQNAFSDPSVPSFPHSASFRIGDNEIVWGHKGWLQVQMGVPRLHLIDGSTDRFHLDVGITGRFRADEGSEPFPEFIDGRVDADYQMVDIPRDCWGWGATAADYLWVRVVEDTVRFTGTAVNTISLNDIAVLNPQDDTQENLDKVTRLIRVLLATRFDANPQKVDRRFRRGSMRTLDRAGGTAAVIPINLDGSPPQGNVASVDEVLLDGHDFAVVISADAISEGMRDQLNGLASYSVQIHFHHETTFIIDWVTVDIYWDITVHDVSATWFGGVPMPGVPGVGDVGFIVVGATIRARTEDSDYNLDADVAVVLKVTLDETAQALIVERFSTPTVTVHYSGLFEGTVKDKVRTKIVEYVTPLIQPVIIPLESAKTELVGTEEEPGQLRRLDPKASVWFTNARFGAPGVAVRGTVGLSPRQAPQLSFDPTYESDGFSALASWIPGGQINRFQWTWKWSSGETGHATKPDRFVLQRPPAKSGKYGSIFIDPTDPLPVLDGFGRVCLSLDGEYVDPHSGARLPFSTETTCRSQWLDIMVKGWKLRDMPELSQDVPFPQLAVYGGSTQPGEAQNTLVVYVGERIDDDTIAGLRRGLASVERDDSALNVLVLFSEGVLTTGRARELAGELDDLRKEFGASVAVNEDVDGRWTRDLAIDVDRAPAWRLLDPGGGVRWMADGHLEPSQLAVGLGSGLVASGGASIVERVVKPDIGDRLTAGAFTDAGLSIYDLVEPQAAHCPPSPFLGLGIGTIVTFVDTRSAASRHELGKVVSAARENRRSLVIVDGVDGGRAQALMNDFGLDVQAKGDPNGSIAAGLGVRVWPTTIELDGNGTVVRVAAGLDRDAFELDAPASHGGNGDAQSPEVGT